MNPKNKSKGTKAKRGTQKKRRELVVGAQGQSSQQQPINKGGEQSPQKQPNGVAQNHDPDPHQAPVTGASKSSPHIPENQPRSVGASNSHGEQDSTRNMRGHPPTANGQGETTETNGGGGCQCGGTACQAGGVEGIRLLKNGEAIKYLIRIIEDQASKERSLAIDLLHEKQKNKNLEGEKSSFLENGTRSLQERITLRNQIRIKDEKAHKILCERQTLDIKLQEMEGKLREKEERERALIKEREEDISKIEREHEKRECKLQAAKTEAEIQLREKKESEKKVRVELGAAKGQVRQKEERERALIKEREEEITKIKREFEEREGEIQAAMTEVESQLREKEESEKKLRVELEAAMGQVRQKEEQEKAIITEREEISKIKREHEEREGQLREKEKSEKKVKAELGAAHEKIGRMKRDYELRLKEAKKRIDTLELKERKIRAVLDAESDQTSAVGLETTSEGIGHRASKNEANTHDQVGNDKMEWNWD